MKKFLLVPLFALLSFGLRAGGVQFIEGSWAEARRLAVENNQYILVDAYTDWCYWCKVQDRETFAREDVGEMVNENFVPLKINFEEGIGIELARKYRVQGYPTLLFFNPQGRLVGRIVGYNADPSKWMEEVKGMLNADLFPPSQVDPDLLDPGFPDFYLKSFGKSGQAKRPEASVVDEWLEQQNDLYTEVAFSVFKCMPTSDKWSAFFLENASKYEAIFGASEVRDKVMGILAAQAYQAVEAGDEVMLVTALELADQRLGEEDARKLRLAFYMQFYTRQERWEEYVDIAKPAFTPEKGELNHNLMNDVAWTLYEKCTDETLLTQAAGWMLEVVNAHPEYHYLDTYAALLYATNDLEGAKQWAEKAIAAGEAEDLDVEETQALLEKIITAQEN